MQVFCYFFFELYLLILFLRAKKVFKKSRWRGLVARAIIRHRLFPNTFFESKKSIQKNSLQDLFLLLF